MRTSTGDLSRVYLPRVIEKVDRALAVARGFMASPLHPGRARDQILARSYPAFEVKIEGGGRLSAYDMWSGKGFRISLFPPAHVKGAILDITLPPAGKEHEAVIKAHPHVFEARLGFHNLSQAKGVLADIGRVLGAALASPERSRLERLRLEAALAGLSLLDRRVVALEQAVAEHPELLDVELMAALAYEARPGSADAATGEALEHKLQALHDGGRLSPEAAAQLRYDLTFAAEQKAFWQSERQAVTSFYVERRPTPGTGANG